MTGRCGGMRRWSYGVGQLHLSHVAATRRRSWLAASTPAPADLLHGGPPRLFGRGPLCADLLRGAVLRPFARGPPFVLAACLCSLLPCSFLRRERERRACVRLFARRPSARPRPS
jgi:hypothetical protein